ncbi:MAG: hypothetical protein IPO35_09890 [Uliginosibacterium sp.]|nr:hypothetical protein [Uliginosibacterium sp.]
MKLATIRAFNVNGATKNAACVPLTGARKSGFGATRPENQITLPNVARLQPNTRYRFSYAVRSWTEARSGTRQGRLLASVTATEFTENPSTARRYNPMVYAEQQKPTKHGEFRTHSMEFVTPVGDRVNLRPNGTVYPNPFERPTEIMFQALADDASLQPAHFCVTNVELTRLGPNVEEMRPTKPVIRYNQVVAAPENKGENTYFTVVSPEDGLVLQLVTGEGAALKVERSVTLSRDAFKIDRHSGLNTFTYKANWYGPARLRLVDPQGKVVTQTEVVNFTYSKPYGTYARNLKRDALHFFYLAARGRLSTIIAIKKTNTGTFRVGAWP